jgi:hypothetical protein
MNTNISKQTFINSTEDMLWLRETHLKLAVNCECNHFKSAIIYGNEDCPQMIDLYLETEPVVCDLPFRLLYNGDTDQYTPSPYYTKPTATEKLQASLLDDEPDNRPGADEVFGDSN